MKTRNRHTRQPTVPAVPAFLALPTEIRYEVYKLVLTIPLLRLQETRARDREAAAASLYLQGQTTCGAEAKPKPLANPIECFTHLRVCHQICDEVFPELTRIVKDPNALVALALREQFPTPQALAIASFPALQLIRGGARSFH